MEPWQRLGTYAAGLAIDDAGARGLVADMHLVVAAGGGERDVALDEQICGRTGRAAAGEAAPLLNELLANGLRPTLFLAQLSNLLAGNISIVHGVTGSSRTFMGEECAAADAVRIARRGWPRAAARSPWSAAPSSPRRWDMLLLYAPAGGAVAGRTGAAVASAPRRRRHGHSAAWPPSWCWRPPTTPAPAAPAASPGLRCGAHRRRAPPRRRHGRGRAPAALALLGAAALRPGYAVFSGATGAPRPPAEEAGFLARLPDAPGAVPPHRRPAGPWRGGRLPGQCLAALAGGWFCPVDRPSAGTPPGASWSPASACGAARRWRCWTHRRGDRHDQRATTSAGPSSPSPASALVTPLGFGVAENWAGLLAGRSGIRRITRFPTDHLRTTIAGTVDAARGGRAAHPFSSPERVERMAALAIDEAVAAGRRSAPRRIPRPAVPRHAAGRGGMAAAAWTWRVSRRAEPAATRR